MLLLLLVVVCRSPARRRPRWLAKLTAAVRYGRVPVLCWCARSSARRRRRCVSSNVGVLPPRVPAKVVSSQHASAFAIDTYTSDYFGIREPHRYKRTTQKLLFLAKTRFLVVKCVISREIFPPNPQTLSTQRKLLSPKLEKLEQYILYFNSMMLAGELDQK